LDSAFEREQIPVTLTVDEWVVVCAALLTYADLGVDAAPKARVIVATIRDAVVMN
jgi:hypothetical protein